MAIALAIATNFLDFRLALLVFWLAAVAIATPTGLPVPQCPEPSRNNTDVHLAAVPACGRPTGTTKPRQAMREAGPIA